MTFARVWPGGLPFDYPPGSANLTALDAQIARAVDGDGGSYSPAAPIIIGGAGINLMVASVPSGGTVTVASGGSIGVSSGGALTVAAGGSLNVAGTIAVTGTATTTTGIAYPSVQSYVRGPEGLWVVDGGAGVSWSGVGNGLGWQQTTLAVTSSSLLYRMKAPPPCTITAARMRIDPSNGRAALPAQVARFRFRLAVFDPSDPEGTKVETTVLDNSPDVATYESAHLIEATGLAIAVTGGEDVVTIEIFGESSSDGNAQNFGLVWPPYLTYTRARIGEE